MNTYKRMIILNEDERNYFSKLSIQISSMKSVLDRALENDMIPVEKISELVKMYTDMLTEREIFIRTIVNKNESRPVENIVRFVLENYESGQFSYCVQYAEVE